MKRVTALLLFVSMGACSGAAFKDVKFDVVENGHPVHVTKFYNDGFGAVGVDADAFKAVQEGDLAKAETLLREELKKSPDRDWSHYNLGILYEAGGDWDKAEIEMKEALRTVAKGNIHINENDARKRFNDELGFIAAHRPKK
jgi:tetratricopeptide (TPR) repeat protein